MQGLHTPMSSFSSHCRKNSGELDVFEATRYFSGGTDTAPAPGRAVRGDYRMSLAMPIDAKVPTRVDLLNNHIKEKVVKCKKQPSSPGGRLATFINSFFQHNSASKKKKASKKGEEEISGGRMMMSATAGHYSSSRTSTSTSGFRTPSLHSISKKREDHHQGFSYNYNKDHEDHNWGGDHELRVKMRLGNELMNLKNTTKGQEINVKGFRDGDDDDDDDDEGGVSDSSSDLFELKNYHEFGAQMSSGLPVYGSTDMGVIRKGTGSLASTVAYQVFT